MRSLLWGIAFMGFVVTRSQAANLAGSEWGFANSDTRYVQFKADGKVLGNGGCNRFFGRYENGTENQLTFSTLGSTRMACPQPIMQKENEFLGFMEKTTSMNLDGVRLSLFDSAGDLLVELVRKDWD